MNIAIVINTSWNIFNFRKGLIQSFLEDGHSVFAISPEDKYSIKIEKLGVTFVSVDMDSKGINPWTDFKLIKELKKVYLDNKIDIALQYTIKPNIFGTLACKNIETKVVNNVSGLGTTFIRKNVVSLIAQRLYKYSFRFADFVFFQNQDDKDMFCSNHLVEESKTGVLPGSGIPLDEIIFQESKYNSPIQTFLLPSRLLVDKGLGEFIEAAKLLKNDFGSNVNFIICGKPEERRKLGFSEEDALVWQKQGIIKYLGHIDNVLDYIRSSDCVVLPSYREGTPRVLLEAASIGRVIITTDVPGCKEVVVDGSNGYLCKEKDVLSLYKCMKKFYLLSSKEKQNMAIAGRKLVEHKFDEHLVISKYKTIISNLNNGKLNEY